MRNLIKEALWLPIKERREAFFVFWPLGLFYALFFIWSILQQRPVGEMPSALTVIVAVAVTIYLALLTISGIVNWHRKLVLGHKIEELNFIPQIREFKYLGFFILISLVIGIVSVLALSVLTAFLGNEPLTPGQKPGFSGTGAIGIIMLVVYLIVTALFSRLFIALPRVSVEDDSIAWPLGLSKKFQLGGECSNAIVAVLILSTIPAIILSFIIGLISFAVLKSGGSGLTTVIYISHFLSLFTSLYAALAFASILSLIYREHVKPALRIT